MVPLLTYYCNRLLIKKAMNHSAWHSYRISASVDPVSNYCQARIVLAWRSQP